MSSITRNRALWKMISIKNSVGYRLIFSIALHPYRICLAFSELVAIIWYRSAENSVIFHSQHSHHMISPKRWLDQIKSHQTPHILLCNVTNENSPDRCWSLSSSSFIHSLFYRQFHFSLLSCVCFFIRQCTAIIRWKRTHGTLQFCDKSVEACTHMHSAHAPPCILYLRTIICYTNILKHAHTHLLHACTQASK